MAATVELHTGIDGLSSPTVTLYPDGSDTAAESGTSATEATNRFGAYTFSNATQTGLHRVDLVSGGVVRYFGWAYLATSGTIVVADDRKIALAGQTGGLATVGDVQINVYPLNTTLGERVAASEIDLFYMEDGWVVGPVVVTDADGDPVDLTTYTSLKFCVETMAGVDLFTTTSVTVSGADDNQWTVTASGSTAIDCTETASNALQWSLRGIGTNINHVLGRGKVNVQYAAFDD